MKFDLFYEGCEVKQKKFKHSGEFSDTQFWLQVSIPAAAETSAANDQDTGPMAFDMISVLCEVDSHSLHPWLALLEGAISGTYTQGKRSRAALRSAPYVAVEAILFAHDTTEHRSFDVSCCVLVCSSRPGSSSSVSSKRRCKRSCRTSSAFASSSQTSSIL